MNLLKSITILSALMLSTSFTAQAQGGGPPKGKKPPKFKELLSKMDSNKDGKLELSEVKGPIKDDFSKIDANKDGYITEEELKKMGPPKRPRRN